MSDWNRIGRKDIYTVTLVGTPEAWLAKKKEIAGRGQEILSEGETPSAFGITKKYWAKVKMPAKAGVKE